MKTLFISIAISLFLFYSSTYSQVVQYPANITLPNLQQLNDNVSKVSTFPFYADNSHVMPKLKTGKLWGGELAGINLQAKVPTVCLDDFRYGHKFDNPLGTDGIGYLSLEYWFPSNGDYLLFYYVLENGMDYYREFLVTTTLSGVYIDHLLVRDGWYDEPNEVNFTQAKLNPDLSIDLDEIRNLSSTYTPYSNLSSFSGQHVYSNYRINSSGKFDLISTHANPQRDFNISDLKGQLSQIDKVIYYQTPLEMFNGEFTPDQFKPGWYNAFCVNRNILKYKDDPNAIKNYRPELSRLPYIYTSLDKFSQSIGLLDKR